MIKIIIVGLILTVVWLNSGELVLALPQDEIVEKLRPVQVFVLKDSDNLFFYSFSENGEKITNLYFSLNDIQNYLDTVKNQKFFLPVQLRIELISLGEIYKIASKSDKFMAFSLFPSQTQVKQAKEIKGNNSNPLTYTTGVPLFTALIGENEHFFTLEQNGEKIFPLYLDKNQLQDAINCILAKNPPLASTVKIQVVSLDKIIALLQVSNNKITKSIHLIPPQEKSTINKILIAGSRLF